MSPIGDITVPAGDSMVFLSRVDDVLGNITVEAGAQLSLVGSVLYLKGDNTWISIGPGASLSLSSGSAILDSPTDPTDGSAGDWAYSIMAAAGSTVSVAASKIGGSLGLSATDATLVFSEASYEMNRGPILLTGASTLAAASTDFDQNADPVIDARGTSTAALVGRGLVSYAVGPSASFSYSSLGAVDVRDAAGKPLGGADWSFETSTSVIAGSPALGGSLMTTLLDHEGFPVPQFVALPFLTDVGGTRTYPGVVAKARYGDWADARALNTAADQVVNFTAMNRGANLQDMSHLAMLDVMPMHHDMGGMGGMGDMGGMMDMMGPMMTQGPGSAWGDFNGDSIVDAVVTAAPETDEMILMEMMMNVTDYPAPELFLGKGDGTFTRVADSGLGAAPGAQAASAGDFDGDGDLDLFIARYGNGGMAMEDTLMRISFMEGMPLTSKLFRNDGHGMFTDVTAAAGFDMPARYTTGGVWNDYNRDGCLDLYAVNMGQLVMLMMEGAPMDDMMHMSMDMNYIRPQANYLYRNNCDGTFSDVTAAAGAPTGGLPPGGLGEWNSLAQDAATGHWYANRSQMAPEGSGLSYTAAFFDYNEDGWPDLLVANDFGVSPLYRNNGDGTFTLQSVEAGIAKIGSAMGFAFADFNRDGHIDYFQSNFNEDFLWINDGDGTFTDRAFEFGVADMAVGWGVAAPDLDNDAYPDLVISTGYMSMMMKASERSSVYMNDMGTRFWDASAGSVIDDDPALGISLATADVNADGSLDLFLGKITAMNKLYLNREGSGGYVRLDLHGLVSNSYGVGAEVTALVGGKPYRAVAQPGGEYASSSEPGLFIGLGAAAAAQRVTVYWPSGTVQPLGDLSAGTRLTVREQAGAVVDAGPDGFTDTSTAVSIRGALQGTQLRDASYVWVFHGPTGDTSIEGTEVMFDPEAPGVYAAEFVVVDRFGDVYGSDFCIMRVTDTTAPTIAVESPMTITASGKATFDASDTTDNDPAFGTGGVYEWTFKNGALEVKATGVKPTVSLAKPGVWSVTLKVTDPSGNTVTRSFEARVTGTAPATVTQDMVLLAIFLTTASIVGIAALSTRIWRRDEGEHLAPQHFSELRPQDVVIAAPLADAPPFPFRPDAEEE